MKPALSLVVSLCGGAGGGDGTEGQASDKPRRPSSRGETISGPLRAVPWAERRGRARTYVDAGEAVAGARRRHAAQDPGRRHSRYGNAGGGGHVRPRDAADRGVCALARQGRAETGAGGCGARRGDLSRQGQLRGLPLDARRGRRGGAGSIGDRRLAQCGLSSRIDRQSGRRRARGVPAGHGGSEQRRARHRRAGE